MIWWQCVDLLCDKSPIVRSVIEIREGRLKARGKKKSEENSSIWLLSKRHVCLINLFALSFRHMTYNGCKKKFDIPTLVRKYGAKAHMYRKKKMWINRKKVICNLVCLFIFTVVFTFIFVFIFIFVLLFNIVVLFIILLYCIMHEV